VSAIVLHANAAEIASRLEQLGVNEQALHEAIWQGHLHRATLTDNHPVIYRGLVMWGDSVAALRDQLRPLGWTRKDRGSYALTEHEELGLAITVASGDEATGVPYLQPTNRSKKGRNTMEAVEANQQLDLFDGLTVEQQGGVDESQTWVLLHYTDKRIGEIRIELSRPTAIDSDGRISDWSERIILGSIPLEDDLLEIEPPSDPDIEITVRRKV